MATLSLSDEKDDSFAQLAAEITSALNQASSDSSSSWQNQSEERTTTDITEPSQGTHSPIWTSTAAAAASQAGEKAHGQEPSGPSENAVHSTSNTESSSPSGQFMTPASQSPEIIVKELDGHPTKSSSSRPSIISRARSSSGAGMLARFTSRGSSSNLSTAKGGSTYEGSVDGTYDPVDKPMKPKLDRAALSRQKSKYKSGVNWDNPDFLIGQTEEPFEVSSSPVEERNQSQLRDEAIQNTIQQLASAGGTRASVLTHAKTTSIGAPYFPAAQRAVLDVSTTRTATARPANYHTQPSSPTRTEMLAASAVAAQSPSAPSSTTAQQAKITPEMAQQILQSARDAVVMSNAAVLQAPLAQSSSPEREQPTEAQKTEEAASKADASEGEKVDAADTTDNVSAKASKRKNRLSFMGFGSSSSGKKKTDDEGKRRKGKGKKSDKSEEIVDDTTGSSTIKKSPTTLSDSSDASHARSTSSNGTATPNGTTNRRRRFNDTRELGLVASQLAAEALMPPSNPGGHDPRQASMMSVLAASNGGSAASVYANGLPIPQPAFAAGSSSSSSHNGSPLSGSPRIGSVDSPRYDSPRAAFARSSPGQSAPSSPFMTQSPKIAGLPSDMLTGLSDSPYPSLPPRSTPGFVDPFGPGGSTLEFDPLRPTGTDGGRMSLPNVGGANDRRPRGMSAGSTQTWSGGHSGSGTPRRSVLQMSMHNPEQELQGLTKMPKSSRATPFGSRANSRAPSRQPTPKSSSTNLREAAKEEAEKGAKANAASVEMSGNDEAAKSGFGSASTKISMFKKPSTLSPQSTSQDQLKPPSMMSDNGSPNRFSNGSTGSHGRISNSTNEDPSALVKVPSPSMTSTSGSSQERSGLRSSSEGEHASSQNAMSSVTTPETVPSKIDLSASPQNATLSYPVVSATQQQSPILNQPSAVASTPIYASLATSAPTTASPSAPPPARPPQSAARSAFKTAPRPSMPSSAPSQGRLGKLFSSRFATKSTNNLQESAAMSNAAGSGTLSSSSSKRGTGGNVGASKSQTNLSYSRRRDANQTTGNTTSSTTSGSGDFSTKFGQFRSNLKRDWFV